MTDEQKPSPPPPPKVEPTAAELRAEIDLLKAQISAMVPSAEKTKLEVEIADLRAQLAALKTPPASRTETSGFFPKLF